MKGASASGNVPPEENDQEIIIDDTQVRDVQGEEETTPQGIPELTRANDDHSESETNIFKDHSYRKRKHITPAKSDADKAFIDWIAMKKHRESKTNQEELQDGDWLFLRSLLPDLKKLSDKRKRHIKLKFATLLSEELDKAEADTETSSTSYSWGSTSFQSHDQGPSPSILIQDDTNYITLLQ